MYVILIGRMLTGLASRAIHSFPLSLYGKGNNDYNVAVIEANESEIFKSASIIAIIFTVVSIGTILSVKGSSGLGILLAGILITLGISQQIISMCIDVITADMRGLISRWNTVIYMLARSKSKTEWRFIEEEARKIFISPHILYSIPKPFIGEKFMSTEILDYIRNHRNEIRVPLEISDEEPNQLSSAIHILDYLKQKMLIEEKIYDTEQKIGAFDPILFLAIGTIIWLLTS